MTKNLLLKPIPALALLLFCAAVPANAASTLTAGLAPVKLDEDAENATSVGSQISVFNSTLRYASDSDTNDTLSVDTTAPGTVQDYRFFSSNGSTAINGTNDIISDATGWNDTKGYNVLIWDGTDPGATFSSTPDMTITNGGRGLITGTIDISGLSSGSIYWVYGNNNASTTRGLNNITMSGTGTDLVETGYNKVGSSPSGMFISSIDFTNEGDYDTISYTTDSYTFFSGVVVTGTAVPEPSTAILGALGALLLLRRRRD